MDNADAGATRAAAGSRSPAEYASFGDYCASGAPHDVSSVGTAEGAKAFSLFRASDVVCVPDPAHLPDGLQVLALLVEQLRRQGPSSGVARGTIDPGSRPVHRRHVVLQGVRAVRAAFLAQEEGGRWG